MPPLDFSNRAASGLDFSDRAASSDKPAPRKDGRAKAKAEAKEILDFQRGVLKRIGADGWFEGQTKFGEGATLGFYDEMMGATNAAKQTVRNVARKATGKPIEVTAREAYDGGRDAFLEQQADVKRRRPVVSAVQTTAGTLMAPGAIAAGKWAAAPSVLAPRIAGTGLAPTVARGAVRGAEAMTKGAAVGGAYGAASGAGTAEPGQRLKGAAKGGKLGLAVGAAAPVASKALEPLVDRLVAPAVGTLARAANKASGGRMLDAKAESMKRLSDALMRDAEAAGYKGADVARFVGDRFDEWTRSGVTPTLLDVGGEHTRALLRGAAMSGSGRNVAVRYGDQVAADLQDNAIGLTRRLTPDQRPANVILGELTDARRTAAREGMDEIGDNLVTLDADSVSALRSPRAKGAIREAAENALSSTDPQVRDAGARLMRLADDLIDSPQAQTLRVRDAQDISKALLDSADSAFKSGDGARGRAMAELGRAVRGNAGSPERGGFQEYGDWLSRYADDSAAVQGVDIGRSGLRAMPDDFKAALTPGARPSAAIGYRQALEEAIGAPAEGSTGVLNRLATSTNQGRNLGEAFGPQAESYRDGLGRLIEQLNNARFINPNSGSQTAGRLADQALVDLPPMSKSGIVAYLLGKLRQGATLTDAERNLLVRMGVGGPGGLRVAVPGPKAPPRLPRSVPAASAEGGKNR